MFEFWLEIVRSVSEDSIKLIKYKLIECLTEPNAGFSFTV